MRYFITGILIITLQFGNLLSHGGDYELSPFKLRKIEPDIIKPQKKDILEDDEYTFISPKNLKEKEKSPVELNIFSGYPMNFSYFKDRTEFWIPAVSFSLKYKYVEFIQSYFAFKNGKSYLLVKDEVHGMPSTINLNLTINLSNAIQLNPSLGVGSLFFISHPEYDTDRYSLLIIARAGLNLSFTLSDSWKISLRNTFIAGQDLEETFGDKVHYYYIPQIGFKYYFD
ncbi:MAG: hypothetical protein OEZ36_12525 [Spirochaetota bacterium]|nr:hypothetical protein [Spirochaetota bacterium]